MTKAKNILVRPIEAKDGNRFIAKHHYSGKVVPNSQLHLGVFLDGRLEGVMQFGPSMDKRKVIGLVKNTEWNGFIELNRMAFTDALPRNSESRAISVALRMIRKHYPHIEWVISYADGTQCGDGTIYRAAGFVLTQIKKNSTILRLADGTIGANITYSKAKHILKTGKAAKPAGSETLRGHQFRYIYFINKEAQKRLNCAIIPFAKIKELGVGMYKGKTRAEHESNAAGDQPAEGGVVPTCALQSGAT